MGKEKLRHRAAHSAKELVARIQAHVDIQRNQRIQAHEHGWTPEEMSIIDRFYPEGEGTEIELFVAPNSLTEVRQELAELQKPTERPTYTVYPLGGGGHGIGGSSASRD